MNTMSVKRCATTASQNLRRELREQRGALLSIVLLSTLIPFTLRELIPRKLLELDSALALAPLSAWIAALLVLGAELVPGERLRGTLSFHGRSPSGPAPVLLAKCFVLLAGSLLAIVLCSSLSSLTLRGSLPAGLGWMGFERATPAVFVAAALLWLGTGLWTLAAGAWVPSGVLAFPAAILLGLAALWTYSTLPLAFGRSMPDQAEGLWFVTGYIAAGALAARTTFRRACSPGVKSARTACHSVALLSAGLLPALLVAVVRPDRGANLNWLGSNSDCRLYVGAVDSDAEELLLYARVENDLPWSVGRTIEAVRSWPLRLLHGADPTREYAIHVDMREGELASTAFASTSNERYLEVQARSTALARQLVPLHPFERELGQDLIAGRQNGRGWTATSRDPRVRYIVDPLRERPFDCEELEALGVRGRIFVRSGPWIVHRQLQGTPRSEWTFLDPLTQECWPLPAFVEDGHVLSVLPDDRVLMLRDDRTEILDLETGEQTTLRVAGSGEIPVYAREAERWHPRVPSADPFLVSANVGSGATLLALDLESGLLTPLTPSGRSASWVGNLPDGRIVAILDERSVVALSPDGSGEPEILFSL